MLDTLSYDTVLLTGEQMAEADRLTIASGISGIELMENAGQALALAMMQRWSPRSVTVLCGPGNNGGDGFVVARLLAEAGWPVRVAVLVAYEQLRGDAQHHAALWRGAMEAFSPAVLDGAELVVDAIFGAGLSRAPEGAAAQTLAAAAERRLTIIAVDVPSGLIGDTGVNLGAIQAVLTVTCCRKKPGHLLQPGRILCGEVVVADIGTPVSVFDTLAPGTFENDPLLWLDLLPMLEPDGNKYTRGHALIFGGYPTTGAARLAACAAARVGAGLVTIAVDPLALPIYAIALTSIMVTPVADLLDFTRLLADVRYSVLLIGPGAGLGDATRERVLAILKSGRPVVLDADALSVFKGDPDILMRAINGPCVLTPHDGEFKRLFDDAGDKLRRARCAAKRCGAVIVLKGSDTIIAAPDGRAIINTNAPPTLATAGAGDVLAGMVLGLMTQGMEPFSAAAAAVWLHGAAATELGLGLVAEDLPVALPLVLQHLKAM